MSMYVCMYVYMYVCMYASKYVLRIVVKDIRCAEIALCMFIGWENVCQEYVLS